MDSATLTSNLPPPLIREVELAAALARERLLDTHLEFLLEFVEHGRGDVPPPRALSIYSRLHRIPPGDGLLLAHRMLVALGEPPPAGTGSGFPRLTEAADDVSWTGPRSLWGRLRKRLRGRVNPDLRRWVEVHTGRAEVAVLEVHVAHALRFVSLLAPHAASYAAAIDLYARMLNVPESKHETLYLMTLARVGELAAASPEAEPAPTNGDATKTALRIIENRAG